MLVLLQGLATCTAWAPRAGATRNLAHTLLKGTVLLLFLLLLKGTFLLLLLFQKKKKKKRVLQGCSERNSSDDLRVAVFFSCSLVSAALSCRSGWTSLMLVRTCSRTRTTAGKERGMERCDTIHDAISNRTTVPTTSLPLELWPLTSEVVIQAQGLHSRHLVLPPSILRFLEFQVKHGRVF